MTPPPLTRAQRVAQPLARCAIVAMLAMALASGVAPAPAQEEPVTDPPLAAIDEFVRREMHEQRIPGLSLAVTIENELVFAKGYGAANVELRSPALAESIYEIASLTKQFTAVGILLLVQEGHLSLDDSVRTYLPDVPEAWRKITLREMLSHTSGIPDIDDSLDLRRDYTEDELVKLVAAQPLNFTPGAKWMYSNMGYVLLGIIIHKVSGQSYGNFLREHIFSRLHMVNTRVNSQEDLIPFRVSGYRLDEGTLKNQDWMSPALCGTADGGLVSSVVDMARWDGALNSGSLLPAAAWRQVFTPVTLNSGKPFPYGFGWFVREQAGEPYYEHSGHLQGYASHVLRFPRAKVSVIVLANLAQADPWEIAHGVAGLIRPDLKPPADHPLEDREPGVTELFRQVLQALREGKLQTDAFNADGRDAYNAAALSARRDQLAPLPPFGAFELIGRTEVGDETEYRYWVHVGKDKWLLTAALDEDGKIGRLEFGPL